MIGRLPAPLPERREPMTESPPPGLIEHQAPSVLIVEDDVAVRSTLAAILGDEGWQILIAPNGFDALATLDNHDPDVVVLDWMTPVLDGHSFLATLRGERRRSLPVLVISAGRVTADTARASGADAYLDKPFDIDELVSVVHDLVDRNKSGRGLYPLH